MEGIGDDFVGVKLRGGGEIVEVLGRVSVTNVAEIVIMDVDVGRDELEGI